MNLTIREPVAGFNLPATLARLVQPSNTRKTRKGRTGGIESIDSRTDSGAGGRPGLGCSKLGLQWDSGSAPSDLGVWTWRRPWLAGNQDSHGARADTPTNTNHRIAGSHPLAERLFDKTPDDMT